MSWSMWALKHTDGPRGPGAWYTNFGDKWWVELHGLPEPIVPVLLTEAPEDTPDDQVYWGWVDDIEYKQRLYGDLSRADGTPELIQPAWFLFEMQFPYGVPAEVKAGKGRVMRLLVAEMPIVAAGTLDS